jgi:peptidoglycan LD-endopeptidase LytH
MTDELVSLLRKYQSDFYPVVDFDPQKDKLISFDFTDRNQSLTDEVLNDIISFSGHIEAQLIAQNALYGIGGYAEHRTIYSRSQLFDAGQPNEEPRRLHLGIDIWGESGTPVYAPLDGSVHSFAFNDHPGDYGATIILKHSLDKTVFYSLYGHLDLKSLQHIQEDDKIKKGKLFAHFGIPEENGYWPPHLHFQLIRDIKDLKGDYPGVCKFSERKEYLQNSPDPDLILQMNQYLTNE